MLIEVDFFDWTYFRGWNREWTFWCSYQKPCVLCFWRDFHGVFCLLCRTFQLKCKSRMLGPSKCNPVLKVRNWAKIKSGTVQRKKEQKMIPARKYLFLGMFHTLCRVCQEPLLHFAEKRGGPDTILWGLKKTLLSLRPWWRNKKELTKRCRRCGEKTAVRASRDVSEQKPSKKPIFPF